MTPDPVSVLQRRKRRHIDVCLSEAVDFQTVTTGFEHYTLPYHALTQTRLADIDLATTFLGSALRAPVLIGAMTGGAQLSRTINRNLAVAAQRLGLGMMLGSQRVMIGDESAATSFDVRDLAPDILLIGNIGLAQLSGTSTADLAAVVERAGADALAVHTNPLQEAVQHDGDTDFSGSLARLREVAQDLRHPVMVKEVGHGIGATAATALADCGLAAIDVAGAGGTSWARVEQFVRYGEVRNPQLVEWGIPTARALRDVHATLPDMPLVASGGIRSGIDAAKALAMGAQLVAVARPLLEPAMQSADAVVEWLRAFLDELRVVLHCSGAPDLATLRGNGVLDAP